MTVGRGHSASRVKFGAFKSESFLAELPACRQVQYLRCYLADLGAAAYIEEPLYFDRDYLSEFVAFYSTSARGYSNACRRIHVFATPKRELRSLFTAALSGARAATEELNARYLGFTVVRPIPATPLGRTVLRWYPETRADLPRVTTPSRWYRVNLMGVTLHVEGLAWQQQDTGVGACATVALWSMFHSSALDEHHAIPTTAEITKSASARWPLGRRVFPAIDGLTIHQMCEAIRGQGLQPVPLDGDVEAKLFERPLRCFSPVRFAASCAALLRSGYPVLIAGHVLEPKLSGHAVCAVGFRPGVVAVPAGHAIEEDGAITHLYLHDDNLGPSVRFALEPQTSSGVSFAVLRPDAPPPLRRSPTLPDPATTYWKLVPTTILAALPEEIRMPSDFLHGLALGFVPRLANFIERCAQEAGSSVAGLTFAVRFFRLRDYVGAELAARLSGRRLVKARVGLATRVPPMSLHLGVVRVAIGGAPLFDVLYDTTDSQPATVAFAHVVFQRFPVSWLGAMGTLVRAY